METINKKVIKEGWDRRERSKLLEMKSLHLKAQRTAIKLGQWLKDEWNVKEVFLFGSLAWSEHYDHLSDIDLFVVGFEYEADYYRMIAKAMDVAYPIPINIVLEEDALESLKDRVKEEGIRLWLLQRLDEELTNISRLRKSIDKHTRQREKGEGVEKLDSDLYFRAMGSILHDFYSALEKSFLTIAWEIDNEVPAGLSWHSDLLDQMSYDIDGVRPAVISKDLREKLKEYLGFRHIFRNVYGFNLAGNKLDLLLKNLPDIHKCYKKAVSKFLQNMEEIFVTRQSTWDTEGTH